MNSFSSTQSFVSESGLMEILEGIHETTDTLLAQIKVHLESASHIDQEIQADLTLVCSLFNELKEVYTNHIEKEFRLVFPVFRSKAHLNSLSNDLLLLQIRHLYEDHGLIRARIASIKMLSDGFHAEALSSPTLKLCFEEFKELEKELNQMVFLEEKTLFPELIRQLEKTKSK